MAISFIGAATGTTSATLPSFTEGDLAIVFAYRENSNTLPALPAGWTTSNSAAGANTNSARLGYRILRADDTVTGTWTNATSTIVHVYRSSFGAGHVRPGANTSGGAAGTLIAYNTFTLQNTDGTSWVAGFAGHRSVDTALETPPAGMTNRATVVDATDEGAGHDTNGGVASWSTTTVEVSGTSLGWRSHTVEIREYTATGIQLVNSARAAADGSAGTVNTVAMQASKDSYLIFGTSYQSTATKTVTISDDTTGESYSSAVAHFDATADVELGVDISSGYTGQSGLVTFTQTLSGSADWREFFVAEYINVATSSQLDKTDTRSQSASNPSTDAFVPDTDGELLIGLVGNSDGVGYTAAGSYTELFDGVSATDCQIQYRVQTTAASVTSAWTASNVPHVMVAASFRPLAAGAATSTASMGLATMGMGR